MDDKKVFELIITVEDMIDYSGTFEGCQEEDIDDDCFHELCRTIAEEGATRDAMDFTSFENWFFSNMPDDYDCIMSILHGAMHEYYKEALKGEGIHI